MSMKTWLKEFYPTPATKTRKKGALAHTIRKWTGLLKKNLRKHSLRIDDCGDVVEGPGGYGPCLTIEASTCALCHHHPEGDCESCPIIQYREVYCGGRGSAYREWCKTNDARPMLAALKRVQKRMAAKGEVA